jgi:hypothetical protein
MSLAHSSKITWLGEVAAAKRAANKISKDELKRIHDEDARRKFSDLAHHLDRNLKGAMSDAIDMYELMKENRSIEFTLTDSVIHTITISLNAIAKLNEKLKSTD